MRFLISRRVVASGTAMLCGAAGSTVGFGAPGQVASNDLPKAFPATKYAKMAAHSPFAPPTAPVVQQAAPTPPPAPGWADSLTATMIMQEGSKYLVTVVDSQNPQQHLYLTTDTDKDSQMSVASVKWGATRDEPPVVTLHKGKEFAQVKYDAGSTSGGGAGQMGGAAPTIPGGVRTPPTIPGAQAFRPGPPPNPVQGVGNPAGPSSGGMRRPIIRSAPVTAAPAPVRPGINPPNAGVRPNPATLVDDDDDD